MTTQQLTRAEQQIMNAQRAYIIQLAGGGKYKNYAIYTDNGNGLQVLWAKKLNYTDLEKPQLFPRQVNNIYKNNKLPCFHFKAIPEWNGCSEDLKIMLRQYNPTIEIFNLTGGAPF